MFELGIYQYFSLDLHSLGQLPPQESRDPDREHRGGLQKWVEAHAVAGGHLWRDPAQARQRQNEVSLSLGILQTRNVKFATFQIPQNCQCQQSSRFHRQQGSQIGLHWCRR